MAAVTKMMKVSNAETCLRPLNVSRDLMAVADLVEMCFADTLDLDGRRYLQHMRSTAKNPGLLRLTSQWTSAPLSGYVWEQDGHIVGNASLIPYFLGSKRHYLIANVAVHPEYRRRGIARQLTESIIKLVKERGASDIWLHVRDDNQAAKELYGSLNFIERTRRTSWVNRRQQDIPESSIQARFLTPHSRHWPSQRKWLLEAYPTQFAWHLSLDMNLLRPGLMGTIWRFINNAQIAQWGLIRANRLKAVLAWQATSGTYDYLYLAASPTTEHDDIYALLLHALERMPTRRFLSMDYPASKFSEAIHAAGFSNRQTLIWMELSL
jgi:GNAT superfamily N-acetyltransferase